MMDDEAAFPVFEAIMVAILVLGALLFFNTARQPVSGAETGGVDLGQEAADTLRILQSHTFADPAGGPRMNLTTWLGRVIAGDEDVAADVDAFLSEVVPAGARYRLLFDNGVGRMTVLPVGPADQPQGARAAETLVFPHWAQFRTQTPAATGWPGQNVTSGALFTMTTSSTILCIRSPLPADTTGEGPGGVPWVTLWQASKWPAALPTSGKVPSNVPYGIWAGYPTVGCTGAPSTYVRLGLPEPRPTSDPAYVPPTHYPIYGLQLVVWFGA